MRYFLVDTENIHAYDFMEHMKVNNNDTVIMFVSDKSKNIKISDLKKLTKCSSSIIYENIYSGGKNAMDFQLVANLSLILSSANNSKKSNSYYIVSNDNNFNVAIKYLKNKTQTDVVLLKTDKITTPKLTKKLKSENSNSHIPEIVSLIMRQSEDLCELHHALQCKFGNTSGSSIYSEIKPIFKSGNY